MNNGFIIAAERTETHPGQMPFFEMLENRRFALVMLAGFAGFSTFCQYASVGNVSFNVHVACNTVIGFVQSLI